MKDNIDVSEKNSHQLNQSPKMKFSNRITRFIIALLLVISGAYISIKNKELPLLLTLDSVQINFTLGNEMLKNEPPDEEIELLQENLVTNSLVVSGIDTIKFTMKPRHSENFFEVLLAPIGVSQDEIKISSRVDEIALVSLIYDGFAGLQVSISDFWTSFIFTMESDSNLENKIYAKVYLPKNFDLQYDDQNFVLSSISNESISMEEWKNNSFERSRSSRYITFSNLSEKLRLDIKNKKIIKQNLFKKLEINDFNTMKFDRRKQDFVSALKSARFEFLMQSNTTENILEGSNIRYEAKDLTLEKCEIHNGSIQSEIKGVFASLEIGQLGNNEEMLPSILKWYADKTLPYASITLPGLLAAYLLLVIRIALGKKAAREIADFIKMARGK